MFKLTSIVLLALSFAHPQQPPLMTARDYYDELYKVGGLDRMADEYVCFDQDDPARTNFFLMARSTDIKKFLQSDGSLQKLPKNMQHGFDNGFLVLRNYLKGVPEKEEYFLNKDEGSWVSDKARAGNGFVRIRFTISWDTLRYERAAEILNASGELQSARSVNGRCETVSSKIPQHAN